MPDGGGGETAKAGDSSGSAGGDQAARPLGVLVSADCYDLSEVLSGHRR